jgi:hypothetical protein
MADTDLTVVDPMQALSKPWQKFFAKFQEIETLKNSKWTDVHQLAYLCQRYERHYGRKFAFSLMRAPSKCTEIVLIKKMCAMLGTTNARTIREYIDWVFDHKIIPYNLQIRSLSYFMTPGLGNEFHFFFSKKNKIEKSTELPQEYQEIITSLDLPVATYGDLAFAKHALEESPDNEARAPYKELFSRLYSIGFDPTVLKDMR